MSNVNLHAPYIVALANLLPAEDDVEELDSHMFQSVGHRAVGAYAELTGLPLLRRRIAGESRHTGVGRRTQRPTQA